MSSFSENKRWSDQYIPAICNIVGPYLLKPSDFKTDTQQNTDLIVLDARDMRIAARVRRKSKYFEKYKYEFTLRSKVKSCRQTELEKVINGLGDWLFYGFVDEDPTYIQDWWIISLSSFRAGLIRRSKINLIVDRKTNGDGSEFYAFDLRSFPESPSIIIAGSQPLPIKSEAA